MILSIREQMMADIHTLLHIFSPLYPFSISSLIALQLVQMQVRQENIVCGNGEIIFVGTAILILARLKTLQNRRKVNDYQFETGRLV